MGIHRVPEFYCCYLLRSVPKKQSFYIGSTPNPVRRLRQHNGLLTNGSAFRTKQANLRPWEMVLCVYGFTSKIAALQFEHAWQHSYHTHFISDDQRIVKNKTGGRSIHHKLGNIRLLLKNAYFQHMDLVVHFFDQEARKVWDQNRFNIHGDVVATASEPDGSVLASQNAETLAATNLACVEKLFFDVQAIDGRRTSSHDKALSHGRITCPICQESFNYMSEVDTTKPLAAFCPEEDCTFVSHLSCLHRIFLDDEQLMKGTRKLIPKSGTCPLCEKIISWPTVVKYSTWARDPGTTKDK
ncbi:LANO_0F02432g1_1 [Lachancea nothofagi CBS 11611]|uniref:LANO_0F02432g1_1 n=1 Tax=Lachancea nothofagi CBS 11611 TaxID=1266666 RepID=A0A1G4K6S6_9SACH|nr:LANO_0F02432g1_1 [Lachancea nothofagi CBS 11611]